MVLPEPDVFNRGSNAYVTDCLNNNILNLFTGGFRFMLQQPERIQEIIIICIPIFLRRISRWKSNHLIDWINITGKTIIPLDSCRCF